MTSLISSLISKTLDWVPTPPPTWYEPLLDNGLLPDIALRTGIRQLLGIRLAEINGNGAEASNMEKKMDYIKSLKERPIALHTTEANKQHYEVPTEFFQYTLGKRMKYSCCLFPTGTESLNEAEELMLESYCVKARLQDGMKILDLGCGWGSLSLFLAQKYPNSQITGLSNSSTQKTYIQDRAEERGIKNLHIITADINEYQNQDLQFDRILSIEMFEHMKNYKQLLHKTSGWLKDDGLLFVHIFCHKHIPYDFVTEDDHSWMAEYFFTGGTMPSSDLFLYFQDDLTIVDQWFVDGTHYGRTSEAWLKVLDSNREKVLPILSKTYGGEKEGKVWLNRWRVFYLACAELFSFRNGQEWGVSHYLFSKK
ncbi:methyltransferase domain-containing protein [Basidiobolus meristosporus CBS 931.73]|uniref:Methyltransferase domain-containing protein n=1 Tax=Basidiobolus meristosporus CBS 931.73 TaxID=1314790 RepID=A0A1Y1YZY1_9FUNG|nr:methyltransferase domain-containing protein [Basidiobolus meristosporus CBS 931.73]|eukprot:ORY03613.1 methyltransferase domain-containing protein [Basidiobolus meristosporus CBS 931.73]